VLIATYVKKKGEKGKIYLIFEVNDTPTALSIISFFFSYLEPSFFSNIYQKKNSEALDIVALNSI